MAPSLLSRPTQMKMWRPPAMIPDERTVAALRSSRMTHIHTHTNPAPTPHTHTTARTLIPHTTGAKKSLRPGVSGCTKKLDTRFLCSTCLVHEVTCRDVRPVFLLFASCLVYEASILRSERYSCSSHCSNLLPHPFYILGAAQNFVFDKPLVMIS